MLNEKLLQVLKHEGVVSIVTTGENEAHVSNTWNSYIVVDGQSLLIPAAGMRKTQANAELNPQVKLTLGARDVMGHMSMGTGFLLTGTAKFITEGPQYDLMKSKYSFLSRVLVFTIEETKQTL